MQHQTLDHVVMDEGGVMEADIDVSVDIIMRGSLEDASAVTAVHTIEGFGYAENTIVMIIGVCSDAEVLRDAAYIILKP